MVLMGSIAVISYIKNKKESAAQGESAAEDTTHFLGQRNLGTFVMYFNIMASFTSGMHSHPLFSLLCPGQRRATH